MVHDLKATWSFYFNFECSLSKMNYFCPATLPCPPTESPALEPHLQRKTTYEQMNHQQSNINIHKIEAPYLAPFPLFLLRQHCPSSSLSDPIFPSFWEWFRLLFISACQPVKRRLASTHFLDITLMSRRYAHGHLISPDSTSHQSAGAMTFRILLSRVHFLKPSHQQRMGPTLKTSGEFYLSLIYLLSYNTDAANWQQVHSRKHTNLSLRFPTRYHSPPTPSPPSPRPSSAHDPE